MGIRKVDRQGERVIKPIVANSYGTAHDKLDADESTEVYIYIDEAGGKELDTAIVIVFKTLAEAETLANDLKETANLVFGSNKESS